MTEDEMQKLSSVLATQLADDIDQEIVNVLTGFQQGTIYWSYVKDSLLSSNG